MRRIAPKIKPFLPPLTSLTLPLHCTLPPLALSQNLSIFSRLKGPPQSQVKRLLRMIYRGLDWPPSLQGSSARHRYRATEGLIGPPSLQGLIGPPSFSFLANKKWLPPGTRCPSRFSPASWELGRRLSVSIFCSPGLFARFFVLRQPPMLRRTQRGYITGLRHHLYGSPRPRSSTNFAPTNQPTNLSSPDLSRFPSEPHLDAEPRPQSGGD